MMRRWDVLIGAVGSLALLAGAWWRVLPFGLVEVFGFITGGVSVWLYVKENVWAWPVGLANSAFYLVLFLQARLYADMALQGVYIVLGVLGWYLWLRGGERQAGVAIARTARPTAAALALLGLGATAGLTLFLRSVGDAAPFLDALTTVLSLVAQYLLTRKLIENWAVWITADLIYIGLYASRGLYLTALLYLVFLCMCVAGLRAWRNALAGGDAASGAPVAVEAHA
jgi:nicotinamide mononucleotide transporter